jgi:hypothetical protein
VAMEIDQGGAGQVVASTATHNSPKCWLTVTRVIIPRNRSMQQVKVGSLAL